MNATKKPSRFGRIARMTACLLIQVAVVTGVVATAVLAAVRSDNGKLVTEELAKGMIGGALGGLLIGALLALRAGGPA